MLDTGDALLGGGPLGESTKGEVIVAAMNLAGYDAMALGPNELSLGADLLRRRMSEAAFPVLSANVRNAAGELVAQPFVVLQVAGHRLGVIGLTRVPTPAVAGFDVLDPQAALAEVLPLVAGLADTIVVLTNVDYQSAQVLATAVPGIDLLVAARPSYIPAQVVFPPGTGTIVVSAEMATPRHAGRRVGQLAVLIGPDGTLSGPEWETVALGTQFADDQDMAELLGRYQ